MTTFARIAYFVMTIVQFFAIWDGAITGLRVGSILGLIIALILAGIPVVGALTGMYGAVVAWDWGMLQAFLLFFWYVPLILFGSIFSWVSDRRERSVR